jgi:glucosyl-3-phosphoglycerate synthase
MTGPIDVLVPARDEAKTIGRVVTGLRGSLPGSRVIVVDNASSDDTGGQAAAAGAEVLHCAEVGLGHAMRRGLEAASSSRVLRTDGDIGQFDYGRLRALVASPASLTRAIFKSPYDSFPVTRLVVEPLVTLVAPEVELPPLPLSGTYLFSPGHFAGVDLPCNWAFDIALLLHALRADLSIADIDVGILEDRERDIAHYVPMSTDIMSYLLSQASRPNALF